MCLCAMIEGAFIATDTYLFIYLLNSIAQLIKIINLKIEKIYIKK